ncbi:hypothetical protein FP2506_09796 [Fulvimarina pelagi HTCC2506]|uniref:Uncharacterized protein n=1 Tax=Fulvimarina pelagi HTCC2506 TaxID=314231 RepID=Q0G5D7_9HYPH|nr:hypothetical protein FP2506_09796 [Fulvimarina pelagi HTCC2506]
MKTRMQIDLAGRSPRQKFFSTAQKLAT